MIKKYIAYISVGIFFGITLYKSEAASWFRIYEMFRFDAFQMYGIIGSAVLLGIGMVQWIKRKKITSIDKQEITFTPKAIRVKRYVFGGILFGLGWALAGACPGPMFVLLGSGTFSIVVVILAALLGTFVYGLLKDKLPH